MAGFLGSETTRAEITIYPAADDFVLTPRSTSPIRCIGRLNEGNALVPFRVATSKNLGAPAGTFEVEIASPLGAADLFSFLADDDWIDVVIRKNGTPYHVMRGLIRDYRRGVGIAGEGTTTTSVIITGEDFGSIFSRTMFWFNVFDPTTVVDKLTMQVFDAHTTGGFRPQQFVNHILFGFLGVGAQTTPPVAPWTLPPSMPNGGGKLFRDAAAYTNSDLYNTVGINFDDFDEVSLARVLFQAQLIQVNGRPLWDYARELSDPMFTEMFCDLATLDGKHLAGPATPNDTGMICFFRDRPFVTIDSALYPGKTGAQSRWFSLPTTTIRPQEIERKDVGRGGLERYNSFFVRCTEPGQGPTYPELLGPLWNPDDFKAHGMCRFDVDSRYIAEDGSIGDLSIAQRKIAMNYHCLNPYLLNGTITLNNIRPDIRIGQRLRIQGRSRDEDETYYVENVSHSFSLGSSSTSIGVTRGFPGDDSRLLEAIRSMAARFSYVTTSFSDVHAGAGV